MDKECAEKEQNAYSVMYGFRNFAWGTVVGYNPRRVHRGHSGLLRVTLGHFGHGKI